MTASDVRYGRLILGGVAVGAVVFGLGSRVLMRLTGIIAGPEHLGGRTEFGIVGRVTVAGVVGLVIFGAIAGLFSGAVFLAIRPWLPGGWVIRGLTFGLFLLPLVGIPTIASSRPDFVLASPTLILSLFGGMILVEGFTTVWFIERLGRAFLTPPRPRPIGYAVPATIASLFVALGLSVSSVL